MPGMLIRALARLCALGACLGAAILLLICCVSTPVSTSFSFASANFDDSSRITLGMWGACYQNAQGAQTCTGTSLGYTYSPEGLPAYSANPGTTGVSVMQHPISGAFIFAPLAVGASLLTLLLALLPFRLITFMAIAGAFLSLGAALIFNIVALIAFEYAQARLGLLFNPRDIVHPQYERCMWMSMSAMTLLAGTFIFLVLAIPPKNANGSAPRGLEGRAKSVVASIKGDNGTIRSPSPDEEKGYGNGRSNGLSAADDRVSRRSSTRSRSRRSRAADDSSASSSDEERSTTARSNRSKTRRRRNEDDEEDDGAYVAY